MRWSRWASRVPGRSSRAGASRALLGPRAGSAARQELVHRNRARQHHRAGAAHPYPEQAVHEQGRMWRGMRSGTIVTPRADAPAPRPGRLSQPESATQDARRAGRGPSTPQELGLEAGEGLRSLVDSAPKCPPDRHLGPVSRARGCFLVRVVDPQAEVHMIPRPDAPRTCASVHLAAPPPGGGVLAGVRPRGSLKTRVTFERHVSVWSGLGLIAISKQKPELKNFN
jgi:hypothetical protein